MKSAKAQASLDSIAIIGMSGRFPGARNIAQFWRNLCAGIESISFFSDQELESAGLDPAALTDPSYVRAGGVVDDIDLFDAFFFALSPREAESMDPQQRVFLECAWEALEDAGCDPEQYPGLIGVYAGAATSTYLLNLQSNRALFETMGGMQIAIGNDRDHLTTHVSYKLNLKGPSVDVQTACSTSLVATCLACQSLLAHQCDVALAGGVSIKVPQKVGYLYQQGSIMSPDGHCRAFDANAQGIVGGNGLGVVVLKRLVEALEDGDSIYAVIKGSATNNDGSLKVAYTAPSLDGQAEVIAMAQAAADVDPETITYVEAHGTGTPMGDPIEIAALTQAFRARTRRTNFCAIGSVKTNIGHLDPAAGVAGLVKTVLAVKHALLPPSLHFSQPNPEIKFEDSPFYVNASLANWNTTGPRRAAVSSFGIGGTNAHVILEEAPTIEESDPSRPWQLLLLSARTDSALLDATTNLMRYLQESQNVNLADVAYTYQVGRRAFEHRTMLVCRDRQDALDALEGLDPARMLSSVNEFRDRPVVFMFPGQGAQYPAMARELYEFEATFREHVDLCTEILRPHLGFDLCRVLYSRGEDLSEGRRSLDRTSLTQPALFVIEYALAKLWMEWGVRPRAMIGHSLGEYVAACLAGVLSLEDALAVLAARGRLMEAVPAGAMLSVPLGEQEVQPLLHGPLCLAATNGPSLSVISGPSDAVRELEARLSQAGLVCRQLSTNRAFHSSMMDPVLRPFMDQVSAVRLNSPQIPYLSNVTGTWITSDAAMDPSYWTSQLRQTVRFAEGVSQLVREPGWILLEVGPGQTLGGLARQHSDRSPEQVVLSSLPYGAGHEPESAFLLNTVGRLWLSGVRLDWDGVHAHERRLRVPLPTYPFERQRFWVDAQTEVEGAAMGMSPGRKKPDITEWFYTPSWTRTVPPELLYRDPNRQGLRWLILADTCGVGSNIAQMLREEGQRVVTVTAAQKFARTGEHSYAINAGCRADYDSLFNELRISEALPDRVAHLWTLTSEEAARPHGLSSHALDLSFYSLVFLTQALVQQDPLRSVQIAVVSNHLQFVAGEPSLIPEKALVLGPCKVISREYTNITCRSIDVGASPLENIAREESAHLIIAELLAKSSDTVVAYSGGQRWAQNFAAVHLPKISEMPRLVRSGGTYLITGGLGGIGFVLAEYLARTAQARLILTGRSPFPEPEQWDVWCAAHDDSDPVSQKIRKLRTIEQWGGQVMVATADVTQRDQMESVLRRTHGRFGEIHGVIHAAGIPSGGMIELKTPDILARVLAPKVQGTLVLEGLFQNVDLDFFVLCSSISSLVGPFGQVDYSAANAFLDAFAQTRRSDKRLTVSVNWDTWQEVGMAVAMGVSAQVEEGRKNKLANGILPAEGSEVFARILGTRLSQVVVSTTDFRPLIETRKSPAGVEPKAPTNVRATASKHPRPALLGAYLAPRDEVENTIAGLWQELLGVERVGINDNFLELGGHSLVALQLISRLRDVFQIELTVKSIFDKPTVAGLAGIIGQDDQLRADKIAATLELVEGLSEEEIAELLAQQHGTVSDASQ